MYGSNSGKKLSDQPRLFSLPAKKRYPARIMDVPLTENDSEFQWEALSRKPRMKTKAGITAKFPAHAADPEIYVYGSDAKRNRNHLLSKLGVLLCITATFFILPVLLSGQSNDIPDDIGLFTDPGIHYEYDPFEEKTFFFIDGNVSDFYLTEPVSDTQASFEGNIRAVLTTTGALYYMTEEKIIPIADNVLQFVLSNYGDTIAFVSHEGDLSNCSLYLYHLSTDEAVRIDRTAEHENIQLALSPNGEKLVYTKDEQDARNLYLFTGDRLKYVTSDMVCPIVSDRGDIYAMGHKNGMLYFYTAEGAKINIASGVYPIFRLNRDHTEIIFPTEGKWYISAGGKEKTEIGDSTYFIPADAHLTTNSIYHSGSSHIISYELQSLRGNYFLSAGGLVYLDEQDTVTKTIRDAEKIQVSEDGSSIYYTRSGKLYTVAADRPEEARLIAEHVAEYYITRTGIIYYRDDYQTLWSVNDTQRNFISLDVDKAVLTAFDVLLFLTEDPSGETSALDTAILYSCEGENIIRKIADNVRALNVTDTAVYYEVLRDNHDYFYDLYSFDSDGNSACIMEKIGLLPGDALKAKEREDEIAGTWFVSEFRVNGETVTKQEIDDLYGAETAVQFTELLLQFYPDHSAYRMYPLTWYRYERIENEITMQGTANDEKIVLRYKAQELVWEISYQEKPALEIVFQKDPVPLHEKALQTSPKNIFEENDANYFMEINGISCQLPLSYSDLKPLFLQLEEAGWDCDLAEGEQEVIAQGEKLVQYSIRGGSIGFTLYNSGDEDSSYTDCTVTAVEISLEEEGLLDVVLPNAIKLLRSVPEDIREQYGAPSNMSIHDKEITYGYRSPPFNLKLQFSSDDPPVLTGVKIEKMNKS